MTVPGKFACNPHVHACFELAMGYRMQSQSSTSQLLILYVADGIIRSYWADGAFKAHLSAILPKVCCVWVDWTSYMKLWRLIRRFGSELCRLGDAINSLLALVDVLRPLGTGEGGSGVPRNAV